MELTKKQEEALKLAVDRYRKGEPYTVIAGYAGVGKSTLIKFIIAALESYGVNPETDVVFTSFTGKACNVLLKKGNNPAMTLHKMLYKSTRMPNGQFYNRPILPGELPYKLIVCDECSMVPKTILKMLLAHRIYVIFAGDPGQLPPVNKKEANGLLDKPHIFLDEVMRQAQDSGIIRLTMDIRAGKPIEYNKSDDVMVLPKSDLSTGMLLWADQILCATNKTRADINTQCRNLLGRYGGPQEGDKVICNKNNYNIESEDGLPLMNGTTGFITNIAETFIGVPWKKRFVMQGLERIDTFNVKFTTDFGSVYNGIDIDRQSLLTGRYSLDPQMQYAAYSGGGGRLVLPEDFSYGYAITTHKSQGSEWDKVLVIEEGFPFGNEEHKLWLYTAVSRSASRLVLVR